MLRSLGHPEYTLGSQFKEQAQECPELFIVQLPKVFLYVLENDLEKFTDYLRQYHQQLGFRQLRYLVTERLEYQSPYTECRIKLVTLCEMCNRAEMCLEISKYLPDWVFNLNQAYTQRMFNFADDLAKTFNIEISWGSSLVFRSKMLSYPVKIKFTEKYFRGMLANLLEMSRQLSICVPLLLKLDNPEYQLCQEEKVALISATNVTETKEIETANAAVDNASCSTVE